MKKIMYIVICALCFFASCEKILEEKPDRSLKIPQSQKDLMGLLDNTGIFNDVSLGLGEICSDNVYFQETFINSRDEYEQNMYVWKAPIMPSDGAQSEPWQDPFMAIYNANLVLEEAGKLSANSSAERLSIEQIQGRAYFCRAYYYLALLGTWRGPFFSENAHDLGVPIRTVSDITAPNTANTIEEGYIQIERDILLSIPKLPETSILKTSPDRVAAYGLASRFYLMKGEYEKCITYADSSLALKSDFLDYKLLDPASNSPISPMNTEVLFHVFRGMPLIGRAAVLGVSEDLYEKYREEDMRRRIFFRKNADGTPRFKGAYNGSLGFFSGLTTSEVVLNKAEALIRTNKKGKVKEVLAPFLKNRYNETFDVDNYLSSSRIDSIVKVERRKELAFRDIRWVDMQRYARLDGEKITNVRQLKGQIFRFDPSYFRLPYPDNFLIFNAPYIKSGK